MSEFVATIVFGTIMSIGAIVWLVALRYTRRIGRSNKDWTVGESQCGIHTGEIVCDAPIEELMERIPKVLRRQSLCTLNSVFKLEEKTNSELTFHRVGPVLCNLPTALYFTRVRFRLEPQTSNATLVKYTIDQSEVINLLKRLATRVQFLIAFPVMVAIGLLMCCIVIPSQDFAIRAQVFQTIHIFHALWPAFMFIGMAAAAKKSVSHFVERVLLVASDPELMNLSVEIIRRGRPTIRTVPSTLPS